ncbi:MAG: hypothetical protein F6K42_27250 [Leptolyngbya sp. SIO1D8]|nr:hypothetical protein [Leptolyngbya sp. SIO1D8]
MKMTKNYSILSVLSVMSVFGPLGVPVSAGLAQEPVTATAPRQEALAFLKQDTDDADSNFSSVVQPFGGILDFFRQEQDDKGPSSPGISRGPVCPVSVAQEAVVWNTNPLLVWQGQSFPATGIREAEQSLPLWTETATETEVDTETGLLQLPYAGASLEPGTQYEWLFYFRRISNPESPGLQVPFQVLDGVERDRVSDGLMELQAQLEADGVDEETMAIARADYFIQNNLPSDALQEVFAVSEPSEALLETRSALLEEICPTE